MSQHLFLFHYVRRRLPLLIVGLLLMVGSGLLEAVIVMLLEPVFNLWSASGGGSLPPARFDFLARWLGLTGDNALARIALFLVLFSLLKGLFLYLADYFMECVGQGVVAELRRDLYGRLVEHSLAFFTRFQTGHLMARVISDTERLQEAVSRQFADFIRQTVLLFAFLGVVLYVDWRLSLLSFLVAPLVLFITLRLGRWTRRLSWRSQQSISDLSQALQETIAGQRIVKAFGMEEYEKGRFQRLLDRLVRVNLKTARITALNSPLMEFLGYLLFAPFLFYASYQIGRGASVGAFVSFVVALFKLYEPIRKLSKMHLVFQQAAACSQRIQELMALPIEIADSRDARELPPFASEIRFEGVSFDYLSNGGAPALSGINLEIGKGEIVALVGGSGAGKSTLAGLIPRFYDVTEGSVMIDGWDVRKVTQRSLREQIAIVNQDTFLFNDTVRNNISYGLADCPLDRVVEAAQAAFADEFILELPNGYDTVLGERGQTLSGGQRQRLAIARAILKGAPILILDEATSALDSISERLVQSALQNLMKNCTTLVIAHRLSTVRMADRIVVLEKGRIVESGTHEKLMERAGHYHHLYELQFMDNPASNGAP